ncbi:MAG: exodeoxyribonuclease III, partial [Alphaproteobacteria bacterium]|nr:exodeoxyribonuclease III [Alphaproteobacteria bacterium]
MKIATWNVNSLNVRLGHVLDYLREEQPDVLLLQELKMIEDRFPELEIGDAGYNSAVLGQKTYNGVAILSKQPIEDVRRGLPGDDSDEQARYIEAVVGTVR